MKKIYFSKINNLAKIAEASEILENDGILIHPTENLYGFGASIFSNTAIQKISEMKNRENQMGFIILIGSKNQLNLLVDEIGELEKKAMLNYWPGPLTIILKAKKKFWTSPFCKNKTVAVRLVGNPITREIITKFGKAIISTSVNVSGEKVLLSTDNIANRFGKFVDGFVIDNVHKFFNQPSTIIKFENNHLIILREGAKKICLNC
ncbi:MAG: L-threonylcarbamoyladenylate synthase [Candidatus Cloacimonadota bacterium]|nr:L-threonylcarbamoyladenylate synthase [Candidatus Cloacimonadota bacterium]